MTHTMTISEQIEELHSDHSDLRFAGTDSDGTVLAGVLAFEAVGDKLTPITEYFKIVIRIPKTYPTKLPEVFEIGGIIDETYDHLFDNGSACLGSPVEQQRVFARQPTLLGFVNNLVVPYLYGYCHWKTHGQHPFGELAHAGEGIIQFYVEKLRLKDEESAMSVLCFLNLHGYRGHHECPCGSGLKVRHCHAGQLFDLHQHHTSQTLRSEWYSAVQYCMRQYEDRKMRLSEKLLREIQLILERWRSNRANRKSLNKPLATQFHRSKQDSY